MEFAFETTLLLDTETAFSILQDVGPEALAVYLVLEGVKERSDITVSKIAEATGMPFSVVEKACYRLGLNTLGIRTDAVQTA